MALNLPRFYAGQVLNSDRGKLMSNGPQYLLRGFQLLRQPGLRRYVIGPIVINILLFASLIGYATAQFDYWTDYLMAQIPAWLSFLEFILWPLFALLMLAIVIVGFTVVVNIIGAPFNALLAERVAQRCTGTLPLSAQEDWLGFAASIPRSLGREVARLVYTLPLALLIWIITLIPGINVLAPALWFAWGAWMMSIQYVDYAADNDRISFSSMRRQLAAQRVLSMGFGAAVAGLTLVPLVNLVIMPAAVCGATMLWCERFQK